MTRGGRIIKLSAVLTTLITPPLSLTPGTRLGVYEVTSLIGEGGMGQVYRATDTKQRIGDIHDVRLALDGHSMSPNRLRRRPRRHQVRARVCRGNAPRLPAARRRS